MVDAVEAVLVHQFVHRAEEIVHLLCDGRVGVGVQLNATHNGDLPLVFLLQARKFRQIGGVLRHAHTVVLIGAVAVVGKADAGHTQTDGGLHHLLHTALAVGEGGVAVITAIFHKMHLFRWNVWVYCITKAPPLQRKNGEKRAKNPLSAIGGEGIRLTRTVLR